MSKHRLSVNHHSLIDVNVIPWVGKHQSQELLGHLDQPSVLFLISPFASRQNYFICALDTLYYQLPVWAYHSLPGSQLTGMA